MRAIGTSETDMTEDIRAAAANTLAEVEKVTAVLLPEPGMQIVALEAAPAPLADDIRKRMAELDMSNTQSIISFGSGAQAELQVISQEMLAGVKNKDVGPAGQALASLHPEEQEAVREGCRALVPEGRFSLGARAWYASGTVA